MKALELIHRLRNGRSYASECEAKHDAATMLERFIALADEYEQGAIFRTGPAIARQLRAIAEGREEI